MITRGLSRQANSGEAKRQRGRLELEGYDELVISRKLDVHDVHQQ